MLLIQKNSVIKIEIFLKLVGENLPLSSLIYDWLMKKWQILESLKLKNFAVNNFKFDENGRKFSKKHCG